MGSVADGAARLKRRVQCGDPSILVSESTAASISRAAGHRGRRCFWTPAVTAFTFLRQILRGNCACRETVACTVAESAAGDVGLGGVGDGWMSGDPSAYAQARSRLPLAWFAGLHRCVAETVMQPISALRPAASCDGRFCDAAPDVARDPAPSWCGRRVFLVDGSTVSMPDTAELQRTFPQPSAQKRGCGFPQARLTAIFCWASGALLDLALDALSAQELPLLRRLLKHFQPGDVIVADRAYHSYADVCDWQRRDLDIVLRLNEAARPRLRTIRRLGRDEQIAEWRRPAARGRRRTAAEWQALPPTLTVRLVRVCVTPRGFRTRRLEIVTTLLDADAFPAHEIARLYRDRWMAELNLRSLKTTLKMEVLRGRSPDIVRKEVLMYAVTYNLIRMLMWQATAASGRDPRRLSFAGAQQRIEAMLPFLRLCRDGLTGARADRPRDAHDLRARTERRLREQPDRHSDNPTAPRAALTKRLLELIAADALPDRPNRIEPRAVKRRPKSYVPLSIPREQYRRKLRKTRAA